MSHTRPGKKEDYTWYCDTIKGDLKDKIEECLEIMGNQEVVLIKEIEIKPKEEAPILEQHKPDRMESITNQITLIGVFSIIYIIGFLVLRKVFKND